MKEWPHEVRELGNEGTHPKPGMTGIIRKGAKDVAEYPSRLYCSTRQIVGSETSYSRASSAIVSPAA